jgi:hypothetical protein
MLFYKTFQHVSQNGNIFIVDLYGNLKKNLSKLAKILEPNCSKQISWHH